MHYKIKKNIVYRIELGNLIILTPVTKKLIIVNSVVTKNLFSNSFKISSSNKDLINKLILEGVLEKDE